MSVTRRGPLLDLPRPTAGVPGAIVTSGVNPDECFRCPHAVVAIEAETCLNELVSELSLGEMEAGATELPWSKPKASIPEAVSYV